MEDLKKRYQELKAKALDNWFTKQFINAEMTPAKILSLVPIKTREEESELGLGQEMAQLLVDWSMTYENDGNFKNTTKELNKQLS